MIHPGEIIRGLSGEAIRILKKPDLDIIKRDLQKLHTDGYHSLTIVFVHSHRFPIHDAAVGCLARSIRFTQVPGSSPTATHDQNDST